MNGATYTLREIAGELNLPESTIRYYRDAFAAYIPTVGLGRRRRYPVEALDVFRAITEGYAQSLSREEIEVRVQQVAPPVSSETTTQTTALRVHRAAPVTSQPTEALMATMLDGERERREVMWQMTRELVRMGEVLDRQQMALVQITQHLEWGGNRALPPGQGMAPVPYAGGAMPAAPVRDHTALAEELHALREELQRERELVERLRRSKLEIERRATSAEAELQHRAESPDMGALRKFLSKDRGLTPGAELLGAHVSAAGGVSSAPARAAMVGARVMQVFTKTPNQWADPRLKPAEHSRFHEEVKRFAIQAVVSHDSYLINLASPKARLRAMSIKSFKAELERCALLGIPYVVSHPGNYIEDREQGLKRNAMAYAECLAAVAGPAVLIEGTAGTGTALGSRFDELAELRALMPDEVRERVGFCADTCHLYSSGHDLVNDWDGVWQEWDRVIGWQHLKCIHLNDSQTPFGSRKDRHAWIGEGTLGPEPFRRIMRDPRFAGVIKIIETPKENDPVRHDRRMLRRLKGYATPKR